MTCAHPPMKSRHVTKTMRGNIHQVSNGTGNRRNWREHSKCVCDKMLASVDNAPSLQSCAEPPENVDSANSAPSLQSVWTDTCPATIFAPSLQSVWTDTWANPQLIRKDTEYLIDTDWQLAAPPHGLMGYSAAGSPMASVQMTQT